MASVHAELTRRNEARGVSGVLIAHAVYLLKQQHVSIRDWLKWLKRCGGPADDIGFLLKALEASRDEVDALLERSRDGSEQTRDRIKAVDGLYEAVARLAIKPHMPWWLRTCLALRNSLYCWPLMVGGSGRNLHGISLPIGLFLTKDGRSTGRRSKVYFRIVPPKGSNERHRRYVPETATAWPHMEESRLHWNRDWAHAFQVGLVVAKRLWSTQNGRFRFVDEEAAAAVLTSSLVVDMGAASMVVDTVFGATARLPYRLSGRSAEAYWAQAVLGLMLPGGQIPLGVVTGRIDEADGMYVMRHVKGIDKKLEYANLAGFSRVVLAPIHSAPPDFDGGAVGGSAGTGAAVNNAAGDDLDPSPVDDEAVAGIDGADSDDRDAEDEVQHFLRSLAASRARKSVEINFCQNARSVADAVQASGWRRATFIRLPEIQHAFSTHLRRLFLKEQIALGRPLSTTDRQDYQRRPWTAADSSLAQKLDRYLLSEARAIKFVDRALLDQISPGGAAAEVGRWLSWKDHEVRSGDAMGVRGPGLGILCLRSTETDNEMRLWSTIADVLSASAEWWERFQWSSSEQAAALLAQLFGNLRADPAISSTPGPDVVVLFDEGNLTQRRTNRIFPDDFRGQWLDLLNPSKDTPHVRHPLNEALESASDGPLGGTRVVVVYGAPEPKAADLPDTLSPDDKDHLERLSVFRFGFTIQAAYAMLNFGRQPEGRLAWIEVDDKVRTLVAKRVLSRTRGQFYIPSRFRTTLQQGAYENDPGAHLHAAKALAPILDPRDLFIASNRDRTLEPEPVLEATWHLDRARQLSPGRGPRIRLQSRNALATLTFLRPFADWDTVKLLQRSTATAADAVELAREQVRKETVVAGRVRHSSRVAVLLNAIGSWGRGLSGTGAAPLRASLADEVTEACAHALATLETLSVSDCRRQKRKLYSEYVYCMKALGVPDSDPRLAESSKYLQGTVQEALRSDLFEKLGDDRAGLDDFPLSWDWFRVRWDDRALTPRERSTYAYVAARLNVGRRRDGAPAREPWDQPWIEYFALTRPVDFDPAQLSGPLKTWDKVYGEADAATRFGERIRDVASLRPSKSGETISWWGAKLRLALDNLWEFLDHPRPEKRLRGEPMDIALRFIRIVAMPETLSAFDFIERRGRAWLARWPQWHASTEWNELAARIVDSRAGWVSLLSSLDPGQTLLRPCWCTRERRLMFTIPFWRLPLRACGS